VEDAYHSRDWYLFCLTIFAWSRILLERFDLTLPTAQINLGWNCTSSGSLRARPANRPLRQPFRAQPSVGHRIRFFEISASQIFSKSFALFCQSVNWSALTRNITVTCNASFSVTCSGGVNTEACLGCRTVSGRPWVHFTSQFSESYY